MSVDRFDLASLCSLPKGWSRGVPRRDAIAFDFTCSRWMDDLAIAEASELEQPTPLKLKFSGQSVLLFGESTPHTGSYTVSIDGSKPAKYDTYCKSGNMRYVKIVAMGLTPGTEHTLEIIPQLKPGEQLRLNSVCVAGGRVEP